MIAEVSQRSCDLPGRSATMRLASGVVRSECLWPLNVRDAGNAYRKLLAALVSRAVRMRSRDAEGAAQEALKRSLANPLSRAAVEYYFDDYPPAGLAVPEWPLDQLLAWLHGVMRLSCARKAPG
jgi:hypothetical protein